MPYAMSVIICRAIPEIDGFKPSHRKLLYTMYQMKLLGGKRTKSANVVGADHEAQPPRGCRHLRHHGAAQPRATAPCSTRLVDSKGNFGKAFSRDMASAASRYTEVRLQRHLC